MVNSIIHSTVRQWINDCGEKFSAESQNTHQVRNENVQFSKHHDICDQRDPRDDHTVLWWSVDNIKRLVWKHVSEHTPFSWCKGLRVSSDTFGCLPMWMIELVHLQWTGMTYFQSISRRVRLPIQKVKLTKRKTALLRDLHTRRFV